MRTFAIAARAVCVVPDNLDQVSQRLAAITAKLVAPEVNCANECTRLWGLFSRVARVPKATLRTEAARAFCRDLDALGQRLDLPPLPDWDDLPQALDDPAAGDMDAAPDITHELLTLDVVRSRAKTLKAGQSSAHFPAQEAARLLSTLSMDDRRQLFDTLVGKGVLGRSDVNLLIRFLVKGDEVSGAETMLVEVLQRLGDWLAQ